MTMNPTMNHPSKVNMMDEKKYNNEDKAPATQTGGAMHGDSGIGGKGGIGTAVPQRGGTMPIFIDIENLDLTVICGNQENYHENINGGFGCMQGGQQMDCCDDGRCDEGCGRCDDGYYDDGCDCRDDGCCDDDWNDDDFDEPIAPVDTEAPCNTCDFSEECLRSSVESGENIFPDQIIRKMAYIAGVPLSTARKVLDAYLTLCFIFDEEPPVRFKKRKYDVHRIPVGLGDLTNRIHKAATALAYGLEDTEGPKDGVEPSTPATQKTMDKKPTAIQASEAKNALVQEAGDDVLSLLPDSFKEVMKDAPEMMKKLVGLLSDKGNAVRIYRVEVMKNGDKNTPKDTDQDTTEGSGSGKGEVNSHE